MSTPEHSLPSYDEPTPEATRRMTREEEAELALGRTDFSRGARAVLIGCFLLTILAVPLVDFRPGPMRDALRLLGPRAEQIKAAEKAIEKQSIVAESLRPHVQGVVTGWLRGGTEQACIGRDGWLFYRPDVEYITGPPFDERAPVKAIVHFRDQLAARGIELVVMPMPVKPSLEGAMLGARDGEVLHNASYPKFLARLANEKVRVFDSTPLLAARRKDGPLYLETDTHWRPETMEFVAQKLAGVIQPGDIASRPMVAKEISALGDIAALVGLPASQQLYRPQTVTIHQVPAGNGLWRPSADADVLLLGDSFANIFSLDAMGWGEAAGFAEHLSRALGQPLDVIVRNSDGAFATRDVLRRDLARGRDRLAGKKLVVWEFAARELAFGDWKILPLTLGTPQPAKFFSPEPGGERIVTGTVAAISSVPRPGTVPYPEHILTAHLVDMEGDAQALVCMWSMRAQKWTPAARLRPGDRVKLRLRAWSEVSAQYEKINRSELDDAALQLEEPAWGELVE